MRVSLSSTAIAFGIALTAVGCAAPPTAEVEAARTSVDRAAADRGPYAADSLKTAEEARAALDVEMKTQEGKWVKSYDKARQLAVAARAAGDKAAADAAAGKLAAEATAARQRTDAAAARAQARVAQGRVAPVRIGGNIKAPTKTKDVQPVYPPIAQSARVAGMVQIEATIDVDGKVIDAKIVRSIPLLDQAALDAVRQWEYTPTLLNGVPTPVLVTVTINFTRQ